MDPTTEPGGQAPATDPTPPPPPAPPAPPAGNAAAAPDSAGAQAAAQAAEALRTANTVALTVNLQSARTEAHAAVVAELHAARVPPAVAAQPDFVAALTDLKLAGMAATRQAPQGSAAAALVSSDAGVQALAATVNVAGAYAAVFAVLPKAPAGLFTEQAGSEQTGVETPAPSGGFALGADIAAMTGITQERAAALSVLYKRGGA